LRRGQDWVAPYYRDLALMLALGLTPRAFVLSLMGKLGEPTSGARQMPSHWSLRASNVVSHSSPVATQACHASGIGLAIKLSGKDQVVLTTIGEGSTAQGEWYEAVNWAAIHKLPVIFLVENNVYAISVRQDKQMAVASAADKAAGLGLPGESIDGLDPVLMYEAVLAAAERARRGEGPTLLEARVHRLTPHSSDDDDRSYRPREEVEAMKSEDPLSRFHDRLVKQKVLTRDAAETIDAQAREEVEQAVAFATQAPYPPAADAAFPVFVEDVRRA